MDRRLARGPQGRSDDRHRSDAPHRLQPAAWSGVVAPGRAPAARRMVPVHVRRRRREWNTSVPRGRVTTDNGQPTTDHRPPTTANRPPSTAFPTPRAQAPETTCRYCAPAIDSALPARRCRCAADQWMVVCSPLWPAYPPVHPRGVPLRMCAIPVASCGMPLRIACAPDDGCGAALRPCVPRAARRLRRFALATSPIEAVRRGIAACGAEVKPGAPPLPASSAPRSPAPAPGFRAWCAVPGPRAPGTAR